MGCILFFFLWILRVLGLNCIDGFSWMLLVGEFCKFFVVVVVFVGVLFVELVCVWLDELCWGVVVLVCRVFSESVFDGYVI